MRGSAISRFLDRFSRITPRRGREEERGNTKKRKEKEKEKEKETEEENNLIRKEQNKLPKWQRAWDLKQTSTVAPPSVSFVVLNPPNP
jgi:hypothetical protein